MDDFGRPSTEDSANRRRRGVSQETESYATLKAQRGHRRIVSNTNLDLHQVLAASPSIDPPARPSITIQKPAKAEPKPEPLTPDSLGGSDGERIVHEKDSIEDLPPPPAKPERPKVVEDRKQKKGTTGFLGMLEAAILYFAEDRPARPAVNYNLQEEALSVRTAITGLKQRKMELEADNAEMIRANQKLMTQHEHYERHLSSLKVKLEELQTQAEGNSTPVHVASRASNSEDSLEESDPPPRPSDASSRARADPRSRVAAKPGKAPAQKSKVKVSSAIYFS